MQCHSLHMHDSTAMVQNGHKCLQVAHLTCVVKTSLLMQAIAMVQGFQCLVDDHSGFGQFAADVVSELREDYPTAPALVFPVRAAHAAPSHAEVSILFLTFDTTVK